MEGCKIQFYHNIKYKWLLLISNNIKNLVDQEVHLEPLLEDNVVYNNFH
jgi:hypothetical protein